MEHYISYGELFEIAWAAKRQLMQDYKKYGQEADKENEESAERLLKFINQSNAMHFKLVEDSPF